VRIVTEAAWGEKKGAPFSLEERRRGLFGEEGEKVTGRGLFLASRSASGKIGAKREAERPVQPISFAEKKRRSVGSADLVRPPMPAPEDRRLWRGAGLRTALLARPGNTLGREKIVYL